MYSILSSLRKFVLAVCVGVCVCVCRCLCVGTAVHPLQPSILTMPALLSWCTPQTHSHPHTHTHTHTHTPTAFDPICKWHKQAWRCRWRGEITGYSPSPTHDSSTRREPLSLSLRPFLERVLTLSRTVLGLKPTMSRGKDARCRFPPQCPQGEVVGFEPRCPRRNVTGSIPHVPAEMSGVRFPMSPQKRHGLDSPRPCRNVTGSIPASQLSAAYPYRLP